MLLAMGISNPLADSSGFQTDPLAPRRRGDPLLLRAARGSAGPHDVAFRQNHKRVLSGASGKFPDAEATVSSLFHETTASVRVTRKASSDPACFFGVVLLAPAFGE